MGEETGPRIRLDKWLWHARFFKTRTLAARVVAGGHVRINATKTDKPAQKVGPGDTLTFPQGDEIRVVRILAPGVRRGPAPEARMLYDDLTPPRAPAPKAPGHDAAGRPTKKDRRRIDQFRKPPLE